MSKNTPTYYQFEHEPISVIAEWGLNFNRGNVVKYIARAGFKPGASELSDLIKARVYLNHEIDRVSRLEGND